MNLESSHAAAAAANMTMAGEAVEEVEAAAAKIAVGGSPAEAGLLSPEAGMAMDDNVKMHDDAKPRRRPGSSSTGRKSNRANVRVRAAEPFRGILFKRRDVFKTRWRPRFFILHPEDAVLTYYILNNEHDYYNNYHHSSRHGFSSQQQQQQQTPTPSASKIMKKDTSSPLESKDETHLMTQLEQRAGPLSQPRQPIGTPSRNSRSRNSNSYHYNNSSSHNTYHHINYDVLPRGSIYLPGCTITKVDKHNVLDNSNHNLTFHPPSTAANNTSTEPLNLYAFVIIPGKHPPPSQTPKRTQNRTRGAKAVQSSRSKSSVAAAIAAGAAGNPTWNKVYLATTSKRERDEWVDRLNLACHYSEFLGEQEKDGEYDEDEESNGSTISTTLSLKREWFGDVGTDGDDDDDVKGEAPRKVQGEVQGEAHGKGLLEENEEDNEEKHDFRGDNDDDMDDTLKVINHERGHNSLDEDGDADDHDHDHDHDIENYHDDDHDNEDDHDDDDEVDNKHGIADDSEEKYDQKQGGLRSTIVVENGEDDQKQSELIEDMNFEQVPVEFEEQIESVLETYLPLCFPDDYNTVGNGNGNGGIDNGANSGGSRSRNNEHRNGPIPLPTQAAAGLQTIREEAHLNGSHPNTLTDSNNISSMPPPQTATKHFRNNWKLLFQNRKGVTAYQQKISIEDHLSPPARHHHQQRQRQSTNTTTSHLTNSDTRQSINGNIQSNSKHKKTKSKIIVKTTSIIQHSIEDVFSLIVDTSRRTLYEPNVERAHRIKQYNNNSNTLHNCDENKSNEHHGSEQDQQQNHHTFLDYYAYKPIWPTTARDFCVVTHWRVYKSDCILYLAFTPYLGSSSQNVSNASHGNGNDIGSIDGMIPPLKDHVRARLVVSMYVLQTIPRANGNRGISKQKRQQHQTQSSCRLTRILCTDLGGNLPSSVGNAVMQQQAMVPALISNYLTKQKWKRLREEQMRTISPPEFIVTRNGSGLGGDNETSTDIIKNGMLQHNGIVHHVIKPLQKTWFDDASKVDWSGASFKDYQQEEKQELDREDDVEEEDVEVSNHAEVNEQTLDDTPLQDLDVPNQDQAEVVLAEENEELSMNDQSHDDAAAVDGVREEIPPPSGEINGLPSDIVNSQSAEISSSMIQSSFAVPFVGGIFVSLLARWFYTSDLLQDLYIIEKPTNIFSTAIAAVIFFALYGYRECFSWRTKQKVILCTPLVAWYLSDILGLPWKELVFFATLRSSLCSITRSNFGPPLPQVNLQTGPVTCRFVVDLKGVLRFLSLKKEERQNMVAAATVNGDQTSKSHNLGVISEISVTHIVMKAIAKALKEVPSMSCKLVNCPILGINEFYQNEQHSISVASGTSTSANAGSILTVGDARDLSVQMIANELKRLEATNKMSHKSKKTPYEKVLSNIISFIDTAKCTFMGNLFSDDHVGNALVITSPDSETSEIDISVTSTYPAVVTVVVGGVRVVRDARNASSSHPVLSMAISVNSPTCNVGMSRKFAEHVQKLIQFPELCEMDT